MVNKLPSVVRGIHWYTACKQGLKSVECKKFPFANDYEAGNAVDDAWDWCNHKEE